MLTIDSDPRVLMTKNWEKFIVEIFFHIFLGSKIAIYLSLGLPTGDHPALQNMKFLNFFLFLWVIFALLDPDPLI
jgi:hypothetical protein